MKKLKCDFDIAAPEIDECVTLTRASVAVNAEIYGAMIVWQLLASEHAEGNLEIVQKLYETAVEYARTEQALGGLIEHTGDWCVCHKHLQDWLVFKQMLLKRV